MKKAAALAALEHIRPGLERDSVIGIGTGSTANYFIDALAEIGGQIEATVASSEASAERLRSHGIPVYDLNSVDRVDVYVDGADEANRSLQLIKGGGAARSHVARQLVKLGGDPVYREGVVTDNGNVILDVYNFPIAAPLETEQRINQIVGVVTNGLFAHRPADLLLLGTPGGVETLLAE